MGCRNRKFVNVCGKKRLFRHNWNLCGLRLVPHPSLPGTRKRSRNLLPASTFLDEIRFFRVGIAAPVEMTLKQKVIQV